MEYYSAIKKNTFDSVLMRWMKLEPIIQSEVSQKENLGSRALGPKYHGTLLPPHTIPLGRPSAPAPSIQYRASNLD